MTDKMLLQWRSKHSQTHHGYRGNGDLFQIADNESTAMGAMRFTLTGLLPGSSYEKPPHRSITLEEAKKAAEGDFAKWLNDRQLAPAP
jgi:hypothetical protein